MSTPTFIDSISSSVEPIVKYFNNLGWTGFSRILLVIGGLILLLLSLFEAGLAPVPGIRLVAFLVGIVALIDAIIIGDELLALLSGRARRNTQAHGNEGFLDGEPNDVGRVYLKPRIPMVSGSGLTRVEIRGNPGTKVIYWPTGGQGLGSANDLSNISSIPTMSELREKALGCGITVLDEEGRGMAVAEKGCDAIMYREVYPDGKGGIMNTIRVR
jgi:hypothetical protein